MQIFTEQGEHAQILICCVLRGFFILTSTKENMITKKRGKGTAVNEMPRKREPGDTRFEDNYDRIFRKQKKAGALKVKGGQK